MQSQTAGGGLQNLGNTCFFNAILQSLLHAPPLARFLQSRSHSQHCHLHEWCVFCEMENVYSKTRQSPSFAPNNMIVNLKKIFKKFKLGRQQDSHQFLRYLVQGMQEAETGKLGKDREQNEKKIKKTKVFNIFGGGIKTIVQCLNCSQKSITAERYYDFNIFQECQRANSLFEGVSSFFSVDKLEGANKYHCQHCKLRSNARKRFFLQSIPQVATFQLKRFTNSMRKIGKFIQYPLQIDLGKYLQQPKKVTLKLFAIIVHSGGSSFSGHYYAFIRVGNTWYKMDDSYVSKCSSQSVMNQQAYILLYEKQDKEEYQWKAINGEKKQNQKILIQNKVQRKTDEKQQSKKKLSSNHNQIKKANQPLHLEVNSEKQELIINSGHQHIIPNGIKQDSRPKEYKHLAASKQLKEEKLNLSQIQQILLKKLTQAEFFKGLTTQQDYVRQTIAKTVKQTIQELSYKKGEQKEKNGQSQQTIQLPTLFRRKSKEEIERQLPYSQLILRTYQKILELKSKMPSQKPRNFSQRCIYNLRNYETVMQKKRKLG